MIHRARNGLWLALSLSILGCRHSAPTQRADVTRADAPRPRGPSAMTPHNEMIGLGPYGTGENECGVMLYEWDPQHPGCRYQLNHCSRDARTGQVSCMSLADERSVACGSTGDACGASVRCECPVGPAPRVADPPNVVIVSPSADGGAWSSGAACSARVARLAGTGASADEPCEIAVHECQGSECMDRWQTLSCGVRGTVCDRPVRCECPQSASPAH